VIAGSLLHDRLLRDEMVKVVGEQLDQKLDGRVMSLDDKLAHMPSAAAKEVHRLFSESPPGITGFKLLCEPRRGFAGYYAWVNHSEPQDLFFAGRSVLHRIDADIRSKTNGSAEDVLFRRLKEGSKVTILFLDPRIDIINRLASEEGQTSEALLGDIATSMGIARRLFHVLNENYRDLGPSAELIIRVYDRVPYFAYHRQNREVIIGFYFLSSKGSSSAAYEIVDDDTRQIFGEHFSRISSDFATTSLVVFDGARGRPSFNPELFEKLRQKLIQELGEEQTDRLLTKQ
jgi:hypothetical protein